MRILRPFIPEAPVLPPPLDEREFQRASEDTRRSRESVEAQVKEQMRRLREIESRLRILEGKEGESR